MHKLIPTIAGALLLILAVMLTGCQQETDQAQQSDAPLRTAETAQAEQAQVDAMVASYLDLRQLLATDQLDGVAEELVAVRDAAQPLTKSDEAQVKTLAQDIVDRAAAQPDDLEEARETFDGISVALIELVQVTPPSDAVADTLYVAYCPMVEASWLQATEELANPYMGQKMLECGEVKKTIPTGATDSH